METRAFCWIDLETTGLDLDKDEVLEVGLIYTDFNLQVLGSYHCLLRFETDVNQWDAFVVNMHEGTGLLQELATLETLSEFNADIEMFQWLANLKAIYNHESIIMAGSSVGQFDRQFVRRCFPQFYKQLHYRVFDVTSLKILSEMCRMPMEDLKQHQPEHRAMNDVQNSIAYARQFFNPFIETATQAEHVEKVLGGMLDE